MAWPPVKFFCRRSATGIRAVGDLEHGAGARVQERPELERRDRALAEGDAPLADRDLQVGERRAAHLVRLEGPELRAVRHDPVAQPRQHGARRHRAVRVAERATVELRDRGDARMAGGEQPCRPRVAAGFGPGARLGIGDQLQGRLRRQRLERDGLVRRDAAEAERDDLVPGVTASLVSSNAARGGQEVRRRGGRDRGDAQRPAEADDRGEHEAGDQSEDGHQGLTEQR